jgi:hypothetical protein
MSRRNGNRKTMEVHYSFASLISGDYAASQNSQQVIPNSNTYNMQPTAIPPTATFPSWSQDQTTANFIHNNSSGFMNNIPTQQYPVYPNAITPMNSYNSYNPTVTGSVGTMTFPATPNIPGVSVPEQTNPQLWLPPWPNT